MTDMIDFFQWPAMACSLVAAWMVASQRSTNRKFGFWIFLLSNILWVIWGVSAGGWALVLLQAGLAGLNLRGVRKNEAD
ncbi:hypothetical protein [Comamonas sp.]|uniref:hypothetical protein n=1 Tax=Comamonas sp. TaxID=34028 RepID=UPI0028A7EF4B|nr:hypothetical protein [Comamonas sp.]